MQRIANLLKTPAGKSLTFLLAVFIISLIGYTVSFGRTPPPDPCAGVSCGDCYYCSGGDCIYNTSCDPDPCENVVCDNCYSCAEGMCFFNAECPCDYNHPTYDPISGLCEPECVFNSDCGSGIGSYCSVCAGGYCATSPLGDFGSPCTTSEECCDGLMCLLGACIQPTGLVLSCDDSCSNIGSSGGCAPGLICADTTVGGRCRNPENPTSPTCCDATCDHTQASCGNLLACTNVAKLGQNINRCRHPENIRDDKNCSYIPSGCGEGQSGYMIGDINGDATVSDADYDLVLSSPFVAAADVNGDYVVDFLDADRIYSYLLSGNDASIGQMRCYSACNQIPDSSVGGGNIGDLISDYFLPNFVATSRFVTVADALLLNDFLNNRSSYVLQENLMSQLADVNGDDVVNEDDLLLLRGYLEFGSPSGDICEVEEGIISEPTLIINVTPDNERVEVSWSPVLEEIGYDEFVLTRSLCSEEKTFYDRPIDEVIYRGGGSSYVDYNLTNGLEYCYSLFAYRDINGVVDDYSLPAFDQAIPGCYVDSVSGINLNSIFSGVFAQWSPVVGADGYQLTRESNNDGSALIYQGDGTQFIDSLAKNNQGNTYQLRAYKDGGCLSETVEGNIYYQYVEDSEVPARLFTPSFFADNGTLSLPFSNNVVNILNNSVLSIVVESYDIYTTVSSLTAVIDDTSYPMFYDTNNNRYIVNVLIESVGELNGEIILIAEDGSNDSLSFTVMSWPQGEVTYNLENYQGSGEFDLLIYDESGNLIGQKPLYGAYESGTKLQAEIKIPQTYYFYAQGSSGEYSQHSLTAFELLESGGKVRAEIRSVPVEVELEKGLSQLVDFDGDGIDDIKVNYVNVNGENIIIDIENLFENKNINYQGEYGMILPNGKYKIVVVDGDEEILVKNVTVSNNILNDDINIKRKGQFELAFEGFLGGIKSAFGFMVDSSGARAVREVIDNPIVEDVNETYAAPAVVAVASVGTVAAIPWWSLLHYLQILFVEPFAILFKKKRRGYGVVYNSLTKEPIDLAVVRLYNKETDQLVKSKITNKNGQYNFLVNEGKYYIKVVKPSFDFPSKILAEVNEDKQFVDLYHGGVINIEDGREGVIIANIPVDTSDAVESDKKVIAKKRRNIIGKSVSSAGPIFSVISFIVSPSWMIGGFLVLHVLLFLLFRRLAGVKPAKSWGIIYDKAKKSGLAKAVVRIFSAKYNKLLEVQVTNGQGQYGFITDTDHDSVYYITSSKEGYKEYKSGNLDMSNKGDDDVISEDVYMEK